MPHLVPFRVEHALAIMPREDLGPEPRELLEIKARFPACTIMDGDTVIGCGGLVVLWPGVGACWLMLTPEIAKHGIWFTKAVRLFLAAECSARNLHRLEISVLSTNARDRRWAKLLGFVPENGCARQYTPHRQDVVRLECVRNAPCK